MNRIISIGVGLLVTLGGFAVHGQELSIMPPAGEWAMNDGSYALTYTDIYTNQVVLTATNKYSIPLPFYITFHASYEVGSNYWVLAQKYVAPNQLAVATILVQSTADVMTFRSSSDIGRDTNAISL